MRGHNVNIYFSKKTYNKIKPLIRQRKVSQFVNQAVEKELEKERKKEKEELKKKLIAGYQANTKNRELQKELEIYDEATGDGIGYGEE